ncbi:MAG: hypothetical protein GX751_07095 [Desulfuromonadaceae bacterium]|nr:hypothetical protein [Desulfuromonadaceae bacterium]
MRYLIVVSFAAWLSWAAPVFALEILSVSPTSVQPGNVVRLTGGPFPPGVTVRIGSETVIPSMVRERELTFIIPPVPEGEYLLSLLPNGVSSGQVFTLKVTEKLPVILSLNLTSVDECQRPENSQIEVEGENFSAGSALLLDGSPAPSRWESPSRMILLLPQLRGGSHDLQVITPGERRSLPRAFLVNDRPEIFSAYQGEDRVNSYEVIIQGRNFLPQSTLLVDGTPIARSAALPAQTGQLRYIDCENMIYVRYPYSRTPKPVNLQIINPNGRQSNPFSLNIP